MLNPTSEASSVLLRLHEKGIKELTNRNPNGNVSSATEIGYEDHGDNVSNLVATCYKPRETWRNFEAFLNGRDHRIYVSGAQRLLKRHQERKEKYKHLQGNIM